MTPQLTHDTLDEATLRQALMALPGKPLTTIYLESETRVVLAGIEDFLGPKITLPPVHWLIGRAFGPLLEIRWHTEGDLVEATSLTENSALGPAGWRASPWTPLLDPAARPRDMLLIGTNSLALPPDHPGRNLQPGGGLWLDDRSPRPLNYPAPDAKAKRLVLHCLDYLSRGMVVLTRLTAIEAYQETKP